MTHSRSLNSKRSRRFDDWHIQVDSESAILSLAVAALVALTSLSFACAMGTTPDARSRIRSAEELASHSGFRRLQSSVTDESSLPVAAWVRPGPSDLDDAASVHIYIEGDGLAWQSRRRFSLDPTPVQAIGLRLAAADPSRATILYLGRPCQYGFPPTSDCRPIFWTAARYGEAVVDALDRRIDEWVARHGDPRRLTLIGYSGGGVVAALLAARRDDVRLLVTIAAPLDLAEWTRSTRTSPLVGSLSPMDQIETLRNLEQHHFVGRRDRRVPIETTRAFHHALGPGAPSRFTIVAGMDHSSWPNLWVILVEASGLFE